jgi:hypothetical protein
LAQARGTIGGGYASTYAMTVDHVEKKKGETRITLKETRKRYKCQTKAMENKNKRGGRGLRSLRVLFAAMNTMPAAVIKGKEAAATRTKVEKT